MACTKTYSLEVTNNSPCAIFNELIWPDPTILTFEIGFASGTFMGNTAHCECSAVGATDGGSGLIECRGGFNYTGPELVCCVDINYIINDTGPGSSSGIQIQVFQDNIQLALFTTASLPPYAFTIPEALVPSLIECYVSASSACEGGLGPNSAAITLDCTFGDCT